MNKILFFVCGNEQIASSRIRVLQYLPYLNNQKIGSSVIIANPHLVSMSHNPFFRVIQHIHIQINLLYFFIKSIFYKHIFLQKVFPPSYMVRILKSIKKVIVYDFDDSIYLTPENKLRKSKKIRRLNYLLKKASLVIVASESNVEYTKNYNANVLLISGPVECNRYLPLEKDKAKQKITIGWIGSSSTSKYLDVIEDVIIKLYDKYKERIEFLFIGTDTNYKLKHIVNTRDWNYLTELELLSLFDIGIMPLPNDLWSKGKGGYKLLQYMALGIPSVASPVGINSKILSHGRTGYLAANSGEWFHYLEELINSRDNRSRLGQTARLESLKNYSYERYTDVLLKKIKELS